MLIKNKCLTVLNLSKNNIGDIGANALIKSLETNTNLTELNLRNNNVTLELADSRIILA